MIRALLVIGAIAAAALWAATLFPIHPDACIAASAEAMFTNCQVRR